MIPEWFLQVMLSGAGIGLTGAIWYFISAQKYHAALWWGFTSVIVFLLAVALYIRNDLLRKEQQPATANPGPASERPALENLPATVSPFVPQRPVESEAFSQEKSPTENETPIVNYPPIPTAQDMGVEQVLPGLTSDKATPTITPERPTIREKSAAEILANLKRITPSSQFRERVEALYIGRWTRESGWQAIVHGLPSKLTGGYWHCSFTEVGSGTVIMANTPQDISMFRNGDSVTISGRIREVSRIDYISLEDATIRGDKVQFP